MAQVDSTIINMINSCFTNVYFENMYIAVRDKEGRMYTNRQVAQLPNVLPAHQHYNEWQIRKDSAIRLCNYLQQKDKPLSVLEVGCGNGWLSAMLASVTQAEVTGSDINKTELLQAKQVFKNIPDLYFVNEDIRSNYFEHRRYNVIVFAASIQYFESFEEIINTALSLLKKGGEIHILDSFFYTANKVTNAKKRTQEYYQSLGYSEMADSYFHHTVNVLKPFSYKQLFNPANLYNKLFKGNPFPWICITK